METMVPSLGDVGGSRNRKLGGVVLIPHIMRVEGIGGCHPDPGVLVVGGEHCHVGASTVSKLGAHLSQERRQ